MSILLQESKQEKGVVNKKNRKTEKYFLTDASFLLSYQHIVDNLLKHQYGVVNERGDYSWKGIKRRTEEDSTNASHN